MDVEYSFSRSSDRRASWARALRSGGRWPRGPADNWGDVGHDKRIRSLVPDPGVLVAPPGLCLGSAVLLPYFNLSITYRTYSI